MKEETVPSEGRHRHVQLQMTADGPCSIIRDGGMYNLPHEFPNSRGFSTRDQLHVPQEIRQTHFNRTARFQHQHQQPGSPILYRGVGPTRREHGKKESSLPFEHNIAAVAAIAATSPAPSLGTAVTEPPFGRYGGPEEQHTYANGNGNDSLLVGLNDGIEDSRFRREFSSQLGRMTNEFSTSKEWEGPDPANCISKLDSILPPPPTADAGNINMDRERSFPPAIGFGYSAGMLPVSAVSGVNGRPEGTRVGAESGVSAIRNGRNSSDIGNVSNGLCRVNERGLGNGMNVDPRSRENVCVSGEGVSYAHDPHARRHWCGDEAGGRSPGTRGDECLEKKGPPRRSSFDKLAALIPGVPHQMQSRSSSPPDALEGGSSVAFHGGNKSASTANSSTMLSMNVERPSGRQMKARKPRDVVDGRRNNKRAGVGKSCAPCLPGEPWDPAKDQRRKDVIDRYMRKRARRSLADKIRDSSPSRSRPKAASRRPREKGKFVKNSPDFVAVTAVATKREQQTLTSSKGGGLYGRPSQGRHFGLKQEEAFVHNPGGAGPPITFCSGDGGVPLGGDVSRPMDVSDNFLWS